ncbi:ESX secretion-associated protein EspG [Actinokineospora bangkokensis]|uniref:ESX secretion-associated protein EspG n=1 Tax=Actinokineospora bangkokensis TaxID=1193682 RepID=A0A1Q9LJQ2_9PSEU|nr:ESX secretion-associated protein EspG [Actinokineospora bangkokensis]OLR92224.1 hypothetical protein BJP25_23165 [Actinokineospora bangkokensis]
MTAAATATRPPDTGVRFSLVELDLLATHAGTPFPFPLRVPRFGRIEGEREVLLAAAGVTLRSRGLAGERGPLGVAAEVVSALRHHRSTVDMVLTSPGGVLGVLVLVYRSWALICTQQVSGDLAANGVSVRRVAQGSLVEELTALVPVVEGAVTMPITVEPVTAMPGGADPAVLGELAAVLPELTGAGQLGATRRGADGSTRRGAELSWLDGPRGRVRVDRTADGWFSVNPLRPKDLGLALTTVATIARRDDDGR